MSAWHIGAMTETHRDRITTSAGVSRSAAPDVPSVDTLITWIPGDAIAFYGAIVLALQPDPPGELKVTSLGWLVVAIIAAMVLTFLGGWARADDLDKGKYAELVLRTIFAGIAFSIWSLVIPGSWWYSIDALADNKVVVPIVAGLGGAVFSLLAEGLVRRVADLFPPGPQKHAAPLRLGRTGLSRRMTPEDDDESP